MSTLERKPQTREFMIAQISMILFVALCFNVNAQNAANPQSDTIRWNASGSTDLDAQLASDNPIQFVTYGANQVDWIQKGGKITYTLTVNSVADTAWTDANSDGSITYTVSYRDLIGSLTITATSGTTSIVLRLSGPSDKINFQYSITSFDVL